MKYLKFLIIPLLLLVISTSCNKEKNEIETIKPKSYFPVYPNSWWKYEINDSAIITSETSSEYILHKYRTSDKTDSDQPESYSVPKKVPFLDSNPIYGYDKIEHIYSGAYSDYYKKWPILSENVGFKYDKEYIYQKIVGDESEKIEITNKIFNGNDSVLIVKGHWIEGPYTNRKTYREYAKNIGLTKSFTIDTVSMDTIYKKILIDYHINN